MPLPKLDFVDDKGELLRQTYASKEELPGEIKTAALVTDEISEQLDDGCFALLIETEDGVHRKYACVDIGNTLISSLYLLEYGQQLPEEMQKEAATNLSHAFESFGYDVPSVIKNMSGDGGGIPSNQILKQSDLQGVVEVEHVTPQAAKQACLEFEEYYVKIHPTERCSVASEVAELCKLSCVTIPTKIAILTGGEVTSMAPFNIRRRKEYTNNAFSMSYEKLATLAEEGHHTADDLISGLHTLDESAGLTVNYGKAFPDPALSILMPNPHEKTANVLWRDDNDGVNLTEHRYTELLAEGVLNEVYDNDVIDDLKEAGREGFALLPSNVQEYLGRQA